MTPEERAFERAAQELDMSVTMAERYRSDIENTLTYQRFLAREAFKDIQKALYDEVRRFKK